MIFGTSFFHISLHCLFCLHTILAIVPLLTLSQCQHVQHVETRADPSQIPLRLGPYKHISGSLERAPINPLEELHYALETMQSKYFDLWIGQWLEAIDWTAAVVATHISATLYTLSRSMQYSLPGTMQESWEPQKVDNEINRYFSQVVAYYFKEDEFGIINQAYDDMLWVVLGWLESLKFMNTHNRAHFQGLEDSNQEKPWYGKQFEPVFAHRARIVYGYAAKGWNTTLCGGGMIWSPYVLPYKNAITNELYISASVNMYLHFPGDSIDYPFLTAADFGHQYDRKFLDAAISGYEWLRGSDFLNEQGLFTDGFHIKNWKSDDNPGTGKCDERSEMVFTYNQGVILSGLRGLWESTGRTHYLEDGHDLVRNVIKATGWLGDRPKESYDWAGLGRHGILEDFCDDSGDCDQDGQAFKGIFFHHLTIFCETLPTIPVMPGKTYAASDIVAMLHKQSCKEYVSWIVHNAQAALSTRNQEGKFGMWWGSSDSKANHKSKSNSGNIDFAGSNIANRRRMTDFHASTEERSSSTPRLTLFQHDETACDRFQDCQNHATVHQSTCGDANDRGRGRTLETQSGGVAVLRAMHEFIRIASNDNDFVSQIS